MPTVNVFYKQKKPDLNLFTNHIKSFLVNKLSNKDITLTPEEISVRFIQVEGDGMIAPVEIEITAHEFAERVKEQDEISSSLRDNLKKNYPQLGDIRVWLILSQLGHSW